MKKDINDDRRILTRVEYSAHAIIKSRKKKRSIKAIVRDISLEAIYLYCKPDISLNERVSIEVVLLGRDSELSIKVPGKVKRIDTEGFVVSFFEPLEWWPIFTYFPLKKLEAGAHALLRLEQFRQLGSDQHQ